MGKMLLLLLYALFQAIFSIGESISPVMTVFFLREYHSVYDIVPKLLISCTTVGYFYLSVDDF